MRRTTLGAGIALMAVALTAGPVVAQDASATPAPTPSPTPAPVPTGILAAVQQRDSLVCGINGGLPGFSQLDEATGTFSGFDVDFCVRNTVLVEKALGRAAIAAPAGRV